MLARVRSAAVVGLEASMVEVEVDVLRGRPVHPLTWIYLAGGIRTGVPHPDAPRGAGGR